MDKTIFEYLIGMDIDIAEAELKNNGYRMRQLTIDNVQQTCKYDHDHQRVNVKSNAGKITEIHSIG